MTDTLQQSISVARKQKVKSMYLPHCCSTWEQSPYRHKIGKEGIDVSHLSNDPGSPSSVCFLLPFCSNVLDLSIFPNSIMTWLRVEKVFTLSFCAWEFHDGTSASIDTTKMNSLLDTNPDRKRESNFRISCSHALTYKSIFFLTVTGRKLILVSNA